MSQEVDLLVNFIDDELDEDLMREIDVPRRITSSALGKQPSTSSKRSNDQLKNASTPATPTKRAKSHAGQWKDGRRAKLARQFERDVAFGKFTSELMRKCLKAQEDGQLAESSRPSTSSSVDHPVSRMDVKNEDHDDLTSSNSSFERALHANGQKVPQVEEEEQPQIVQSTQIPVDAEYDDDEESDDEAELREALQACSQKMPVTRAAGPSNPTKSDCVTMNGQTVNITRIDVEAYVKKRFDPEKRRQQKERKARKLIKELQKQTEAQIKVSSRGFKQKFHFFVHSFSES